jgi:hypothetical protein
MASWEGRVTEARVRAEILADPEVQRLRREVLALDQEVRGGAGRRLLPAQTPEQQALLCTSSAAEEAA